MGQGAPAIRRSSGCQQPGREVLDHGVDQRLLSRAVQKLHDPAQTLPVWNYAGVPAEFIGTEAQLTFHLVEQEKHKFHLDLKADYLRATDPDTHTPLPRITPFRFGGGVTYEWSERFTASLDV